MGRILEALRQVISYQELSAIDDQEFIAWLSSHIDGSGYMHGKDRGYKAHFANYLKDFKPAMSMKVYRGLTWGSSPEKVNQWFLDHIGITDIPQEGMQAIHNVDWPSSWTTEFKTAKDFAEDRGVVVSVMATSSNTLMDVSLLKAYLCDEDLDPKWKDVCDYSTDKEFEITLLPGSYKVKVEYVTPNVKEIDKTDRS
jgi:hypothetical protein